MRLLMLLSITLFSLASYIVLAQDSRMTFFITSEGPGNGANLGGLEGADVHSQHPFVDWKVFQRPCGIATVERLLWDTHCSQAIGFIAGNLGLTHNLHGLKTPLRGFN